MKNKNVIYTAIFGDYDGLIPQPRVKGFDFICFTDSLKPNTPPWEIRIIEQPVPDDTVRSSRFIKINAHLFLKDYEASIFIDGNYLIIGDLNKLVALYLNKFSMACFDHSQYKGEERNSIQKEFDAITVASAARSGLQKELPAMREQMEYYRQTGFSDDYGLVHSAVLLRKHNASDVIKVMEDWWHIVKNYSRRDQLSFNYAAWKNNFKYNIIPGTAVKNNGFFYRLGAHRKNWRKKILKVKIKLLLGLVK